MNFIRAAIVALLVVWLQIATLPAIRPFGVVPNLALVVILLLAIRMPIADGLGLAVVIGWLLDANSGSDYGLRVGFYTLAVVLVNLLRGLGSDLENISLQASLVVAGTVLFNIAILANLALHHDGLPLGFVGLKLVIEVGLNLVLLVVMRWVLARLVGKSTEMVVNIGGRRG